MTNVVKLNPAQEEDKFYLDCAKAASDKISFQFALINHKVMMAEKRRNERDKRERLRKRLLARLPKMKKKELRRNLEKLLSK